MTEQQMDKGAIDPRIVAYAAAHASPHQDPVSDAIRERTRKLYPDVMNMLLDDDEARLLSWLVRLSGARLAVEVGTFTGISSTWIARGLPPDGRLVCFELEERYVEVARQAWREAGVDDRIEVRVGPANERLTELPELPIIDFAFVDADKAGYLEYVDLLLPRLAPGGLITLDNVLRRGDVADPSVHDDGVEVMRAFNDAVADRDDCETLLLTVGDGLMLIRRSDGHSTPGTPPHTSGVTRGL